MFIPVADTSTLNRFLYYWRYGRARKILVTISIEIYDSRVRGDKYCRSDNNACRERLLLACKKERIYRWHRGWEIWDLFLRDASPLMFKPIVSWHRYVLAGHLSAFILCRTQYTKAVDLFFHRRSERSHEYFLSRNSHDTFYSVPSYCVEVQSSCNTNLRGLISMNIKRRNTGIFHENGLQYFDSNDCWFSTVPAAS